MGGKETHLLHFYSRDRGISTHCPGPHWNLQRTKTTKWTVVGDEPMWGKTGLLPELKSEICGCSNPMLQNTLEKFRLHQSLHPCHASGGAETCLLSWAFRFTMAWRSSLKQPHWFCPADANKGVYQHRVVRQCGLGRGCIFDNDNGRVTTLGRKHQRKDMGGSRFIRMLHLNSHFIWSPKQNSSLFLLICLLYPKFKYFERIFLVLFFRIKRETLVAYSAARANQNGFFSRPFPSKCASFQFFILCFINFFFFCQTLIFF